MSGAGEAAGVPVGKWPFFYEAQREELRHGPHLVCVQGGRGLGRTNFLMELQRITTGAQVGVPRKGFLDGRRRNEARTLLPELVKDPGVPAIFIDNLDALLMPTDPAVDAAVLDAIYNLPGHRRLIVSIALLSDEALSRSEAWSIGIMPLQPRVDLDPWAIPWQDFLRSAAARKWAEDHYGRAEVRVWERRLRLDEDFVSLWSRVVIDLTGGHPTLVGPTTEALRRLVEPPEPPASATDGQPTEALTLEELLRRYLSSILATHGLPALRRRIGALRTGKPVEQEAYRSLVALARGEPLAWSPQYALITQVIKRDGLAYEKAGDWRIPGSLLRAELLSAEEPADAAGSALFPSPAAAALRVLSGNPDDQRGMLIFTTPAGQETLVLSGLSWKIFRRLHEAGGESVSLKTFGDQLGKKEQALRSAIRRLKETLREAGHEELMRNTRGGYALRLPA